MQAMRLRSRHLSLIALVFAVIPGSFASDAQPDLRAQYQGKTFLLRGFYDGVALRYDSTGALRGSATPGDWTTDGVVQLDDVHLSGSRLTIKASRLVVSNSHRVLFADVPKSKNPIPSLEIEAGVPNPSPDQLNAAMSKIFLTQEDDFAALVPDYWKPCVRAAQLGKDPYCHFSPEFLSIPGAQSSDHTTQAIPLNGPYPHFGPGVKPPSRIFTQEPSFNDSARLAKYQGTVILGLTVDEEGLAKDVHITAPLGYGLDEQAVHAVQTWRFKPAEKDGQPVRLQIEVEVTFHLQ
jgi:TonB family protein